MNEKGIMASSGVYAHSIVTVMKSICEEQSGDVGTSIPLGY